MEREQETLVTEPIVATGGRRRNKALSAQCTAAQKAEAILKVWAERQTPAQICREMGITWTILNHWQERAMEGMLQALEPRVALDKGPALSPRLQALLKKRMAVSQDRLMRRIKRLEQKNPVQKG